MSPSASTSQYTLNIGSFKLMANLIATLLNLQDESNRDKSFSTVLKAGIKRISGNMLPD